MEGQNYMSVKQVASSLGIGKGKAYALMQSKGFPAVRVGGTFRVSAELFDDWFKKHIGKTFEIKPQRNNDE